MESGEWSALTFPLGFVFVEVMQYQEEKVLLVHFLGGKKFDQWKSELVERLVQFGKANGCAAIEAGCRVGLEKKLKPLGFERWHVLIRKEL